MACNHIVEDGKIVGHICRTPMVEIHRGEDVKKYCFGCRKHLAHNWVVMTTKEPSWYAPNGSWECSRCKEDRVDFPGTWREYDE